MRTKKSILNILSGVIGQALIIIVVLLNRRCFLKFLGEEYLGVNSLVANILSFLSMAELGIGSAITFSLYKPLAERDYEQLAGLMRIYKIAYFIIGIVVFCMGMLLLPFVHLFLKNGDEIPGIRIIYFLFLVNTSVSYFFSYKAALIIADQKKYIYNIVYYLSQLVMYSIQVLIMVKTKNYYLYIFCQIIITIILNMTLSTIANKKYPFLKYKGRKEKLVDNKVVFEIKKNTMSLILNRIGTTLVNSTDNILISKMIGIVCVTKFTNYTIITNAISSVLYQGMDAIVSSLGNLAIEGTNERKKEVFYITYIGSVWIYGLVSISIYVLLSPFICLLYGSGYVFKDNLLVLLICLNLYIASQTVVTNMQISAMGLYWYVRYKGIVEAIVNLIASIILGNVFGIIGILLGTTISHIFWSMWIETRTVFKYGLHISQGKYFLKFFFDTIATVGIALCTCYFANLLNGDGIDTFVKKIVICLFLPNILYLLYFFRRKEFRDLCKTLNILLVRK